MAVKTEFSTQDFETILSQFDLGEYRSFKPFKHGAVQTNLLLVTTKGQFVFRYYESRSKEYALFEGELLEYMVAHSYPCPAPIRNRQGELVGVFNGKPFALFQFLEGRHSTSLTHYRQVTAAMGKLHTITLGYIPPYSETRDTYDPQSCWRNATVGAQKIGSETEAQERLRWLRTELDKLQLPAELPEGICHGDCHYSNFLYENGKLAAVLDFDDASYIPFLYDVANLIFFWTWENKGEIDFVASRKLLKIYQRQRTLTDLEKQHLFDYLKMVIFMGIGWVFDTDEDFRNARRKIDLLNTMGRDEFRRKMFKAL
ncbi:MAG: homoserine kinase [Anaerolineae bacterium]|nr:homoserine kinase [Anaerolineae bacterium]